jgi:hypothetical protein
MPSDRDPWSSGGEATRGEVREIFARHAQHGAADAPEIEQERRKPVPGFLLLPARLWQLLPVWGKLAVSGLFAALAVALAVLLPPALENAAQNRENQRLAEAAKLEQIRRELVLDQRPRRATVPLPLSTAAVSAAVAEDFERRVRAGQPEGPAGPTT